MSYPTPSVVSKDVELLQGNFPQCHDIVTQEIPETEGSKAPLACYVQKMENLVSGSEDTKPSAAMTYPTIISLLQRCQHTCPKDVQRNEGEEETVYPVGLYYNTGHPGYSGNSGDTGSQLRRVSGDVERGGTTVGNAGEIKAELSDDRDRVDVGKVTTVNSAVNGPVSRHGSVINPAKAVFGIGRGGDRTSDRMIERPYTSSTIADHLQGHTGRAAGKTSSRCKICNKTFGETTNLPNDERIHTSEKPYICKTCSTCRSFSQIPYLRSDEGKHTGAKRHTCYTCGKAFSLVCKLQSHQSIRAGEKPYSCISCFAKSQLLEKHVRTHTGEKPYTCHHCGKTFASLSNCKDHERTHTGEKPYLCNYCGKAFAQISTFKQHERTHTGEKPFRCSICSLQFTQSQHLRRHELTHTDNKPYTCDICSKAFSRSDDLKTHERTHTGEKPYKCDICNQTFSHSSNFKEHERTHTGFKPYECDICSKSFSRSSHLKRHELTHTCNTGR